MSRFVVQHLCYIFIISLLFMILFFTMLVVMLLMVVVVGFTRMTVTSRSVMVVACSVIMS